MKPHYPFYNAFYVIFMRRVTYPPGQYTLSKVLNKLFVILEWYSVDVRFLFLFDIKEPNVFLT